MQWIGASVRSTVPSANPFYGGFQVKFWKEEFKNIKLYQGSDTPIGNFDGYPLNLSVNNGNQDTVFRRALSYHAFMCHNKWRIEKVPGLIFPTDGDLSAYAGSYKETRANYLNQLKKGMKTETGEQNDEEDA